MSKIICGDCMRLEALSVLRPWTAYLASRLKQTNYGCWVDNQQIGSCTRAVTVPQLVCITDDAAAHQTHSLRQERRAVKTVGPHSRGTGTKSQAISKATLHRVSHTKTFTEPCLQNGRVESTRQILLRIALVQFKHRNWPRDTIKRSSRPLFDN